MGVGSVRRFEERRVVGGEGGYLLVLCRRERLGGRLDRGDCDEVDQYLGREYDWRDAQSSIVMLSIHGRLYRLSASRKSPGRG